MEDCMGILLVLLPLTLLSRLFLTGLWDSATVNKH